MQCELFFKLFIQGSSKGPPPPPPPISAFLLQGPACREGLLSPLSQLCTGELSALGPLLRLWPHLTHRSGPRGTGRRVRRPLISFAGRTGRPPSLAHRSRWSRVEGAGSQRWHLRQPGPAPSPGNRPAWCQCGQSPGHSARPPPAKGELGRVERDTLPTLSRPSFVKYSQVLKM